MSDELADDLLAEFLDESGQLLDRLHERLLTLDERLREVCQTPAPPCDPELLNEMFRSAHSLKGLSAMLGLADIHLLTHKVEGVLDAARREVRGLSADAVEVLFQAQDRLARMVDRIRQPQAPAVDCTSVIDDIERLLSADDAGRWPISRDECNGAAEQLASRLGERVAMVGRGVASRSPSDAATNASSRLLHTLAPAGNSPTGATVNNPVPTIRIEIDRLNELAHLASELAIATARFRRIHADLSHMPDDKNALVMSVAHELGEAFGRFESISNGIQKCVTDARMAPIGPLFGRFHRVVRDIARANGKDVRLVIRGEQTSLEKRTIDKLGDPLLHMVRNAADHGIELPNVRHCAGKLRHGTITLEACGRGQRIVIRVSDDGQGLNESRILAKAVERGIVTAADAGRLTSRQVFQLIWEPGFSTAQKVTEISGRGMGMDIVRAKIEELNGTIELESRHGEGTTFEIDLPRM